MSRAIVTEGPSLSPDQALAYQPPVGRAAISFVSVSDSISNTVSMKAQYFSVINGATASHAATLRENDKAGFFDAAENGTAGSLMSLRMSGSFIDSDEHLKAILQLLHYSILTREVAKVQQALDKALTMSSSCHLCLVLETGDLIWIVNAERVANYT